MFYFLSFGGGSQNHLEALERILGQANALGVFDQVTGLSDADLKADSEFWTKHGDFIESHPRGYGHWLWKPYILLKALSKMNDGDLLMYLDSGCEIDVRKKDELALYLEHVNANGIWGNNVQLSNDITYTKRDLSILFDLPDEVLKLGHIQAGVLILKKDQRIVDLVSEWYSICESYRLINDDPSIIENFPTFVDHRHDQSVFNLVLKRRDMWHAAEYKGAFTLVRILQNRSGQSRLH